MAAEPPVIPATTLPDANPAGSDEPMVGRKVGPYEVVRRIGQGGMGVVYEARHNKLEQRAAIKFLHQEFSRDAKLLQRFFNEARAISMSRHASIVTIYDFGQLDDGTAYILMEFLEGESLMARLTRVLGEGKTLGLHMVVELGRQVAAAMALIHSKSIVHRDLKPENIFVVPDSAASLGERVKLLDFGIVKFLEGSVRKTTVGMILGTPLYMSPEQCEGAEDLDAKVDVYSLGILLYEMLAGKLPFIADTAAALMRQHMHKEPPPLRDQVKDLPPELAELITQMLAKKAADRPSMAEVLEVLEALLPTVAVAVLARPITGARRILSGRNRTSMPGEAAAPANADPFAATLGGVSPSAAGAVSPVSASAGAAGVTQRDGLSGVPGAPLSGLASGPVSGPVNGPASGPVASGSPGRVLVSSASQSGLMSIPLSRPGVGASDPSRTDTVIALARRPVNLFVALALLFLFFAVGWRMLQKSAVTPPPRSPTVVESPLPPAVPSPSPGAAPSPPPLPALVPGAESREHGELPGESHHHGKKHKKSAEAQDLEEAPPLPPPG